MENGTCNSAQVMLCTPVLELAQRGAALLQATSAREGFAGRAGLAAGGKVRENVLNESC